MSAIRSIRLRGVTCGLALASSLALGGCNPEWSSSRQNTLEANRSAPSVHYKTEVLALLRSYLNNPIGVRDAYISEPALRSVENFERYSLCVRYTARDSSGKYMPSKDSMVLFRNGRADRIIDAAREACQTAAYQPFPELENLRPLERVRILDPSELTGQPRR